jgi:hypothetical protein
VIVDPEYMLVMKSLSSRINKTNRKKGGLPIERSITRRGQTEAIVGSSRIHHHALLL